VERDLLPVALLPRIRACISGQVRTGVPLNDTKRSPALSPARAAGLTGSPFWHTSLVRVAGITQAETWSTLVCTISSDGLPYVAKRPAKITKAIRRLTVGPPAITTTFFHHAIR
jgi:hypothetical protein